MARELEGKSYRQIGDELGMSQVVVESTLFRARRRLSEEFQELTSGRRCERVQRIIATAEGRRLGMRERRAVSTHIEHCRPCRREALDAGLRLTPPVPRRLRKVAAAILPVPLLPVLRRTLAAVHRRAYAPAASTIRLGQSLGALGPGRAAATVAAVAAGVGGGLLTQAGPPAAQAATRPAVTAQALTAQAAPASHRFIVRIPAGVRTGRHPAARARPRRHTGPGTSASGSASPAGPVSSSSPAMVASPPKDASATVPLRGSASGAGSGAGSVVRAISSTLGSASTVANGSAGGLVRSTERAAVSTTAPISSLLHTAGQTLTARSGAGA